MKNDENQKIRDHKALHVMSVIAAFIEEATFLLHTLQQRMTS